MRNPLTLVTGAWRHLSLRVQLVTITALIATAVAGGLVLVVQVSLAGAAANTSQQMLHDRISTLVASIDAESRRGEIAVPRTLLGPGVAVYNADGEQIAGSVPPSMREEFHDLSEVTGPRSAEAGEDFAIAARPFTTGSGTRGVVVLTEPLGPYENSERAAFVVSVVAGGLLVLIAAGSAAWISKRVLSPVEEMATTADEWSQHDLERRFDLGAPTNEIRALGNTLDNLLERVAGVIRAEQRLTAELAHELRTPLTTLHGTAELMAMHDTLDQQQRDDIALILNTAASMSETIGVLLATARQSSTINSLGRDHTLVAELTADLEALSHVPGSLSTTLPDTLAINAPKSVAIRALAPVIDNALQLASHVYITARRHDRVIDIDVSDTGPGISDDIADTLFEPGRSQTGGSGLGLSLARRVARSAGGDVTLTAQHNPHGGATFTVTFPGGPWAGPS